MGEKYDEGNDYPNTLHTQSFFSGPPLLRKKDVYVLGSACPMVYCPGILEDTRIVVLNFDCMQRSVYQYRDPPELVICLWFAVGLGYSFFFKAPYLGHLNAQPELRTTVQRKPLCKITKGLK